MSEKKQEALAKFDDFKNVNEALAFAEKLIGTPAIPVTLKTPEEVVSIISFGRELGFKPLLALNNISLVKGKMILSVHMFAALAKQQGYDYRLLKDFEAEITDPSKPDQVTMVTEIEFFWISKVTKQVMSHKHRITWNEIIRMELDQRDNYKKMPRIMLRTRCLVMGLRFANPVGTMGMYSEEEAYESIAPEMGEKMRAVPTEDGGIDYVPMEEIQD
jgi:hypothetical protein